MISEITLRSILCAQCVKIIYGILAKKMCFGQKDVFFLRNLKVGLESARIACMKQVIVQYCVTSDYTYESQVSRITMQFYRGLLVFSSPVKFCVLVA